MFKFYLTTFKFRPFFVILYILFGLALLKLNILKRQFCSQTFNPLAVSISGLSSNLKLAAPILDTWPSALAFQAVNKGVEGSALFGRPNLRPSPHILLCTPRPTLTHPLGLTYTQQGPQGSISSFRSSTGLLSSVYPHHPPCLSLYSPTIHLSILSINIIICPSSIQTSSQSQKTFVIHPSALLLSLPCMQICLHLIICCPI